jgi:leader peptidase (prepilin peptidase)/N-methyltransferase
VLRDEVHVSVVTWAAVPVLGLVAVEDLRHRRIRNRDLLLLSVVVAVAYVDGDQAVVLRAGLGAAMAAVPLLVAAIAQPVGMGGGDVKLAAVIGTLLGLISPWFSLVAVGGGLVLAMAVAAARSAVRVSLGPPLATAAMVALLVADAVA